MFMVDGMEDKDVAALKSKIEQVDHVKNVLWYDSIADISVPKSMLPKDIYEVFNSDKGTMMAIFFDDTTSADETLDAVKEIRHISGKQCFLSGMSTVVEDTKELSEKETPIYVLIAVLLSTLVLAVTMESAFVQYRNGNRLQFGKQYLPWRDLLCDEGAFSGTSAWSDHGLLDFPDAQLSGTAGAI